MSKATIDLNSDMGEGFGSWKIGDDVDDAIMPLISSANIATGFHAGDPNIMNRTVVMAREHGIGIGAHPGFRDLVGFGRRDLNENAEGLVNGTTATTIAPKGTAPRSQVAVILMRFDQNVVADKTAA